MCWRCLELESLGHAKPTYQRQSADLTNAPGSNSHGFPRGYLTRSKTIHGFRTGELVSAIVPRGKKAGTHIGRVAVRASGSFNIQTENSTIQGINWRHCRRVMPDDGYTYTQQTAMIPPTSHLV
jgi:hypothetical protein